LAFVVGEVELSGHLLDSALDLEELSFSGVLGEVEGAAGAGEAVGATWRRSRSSLQRLPLPGMARRCRAQQARPASVPCPPRPGSRPVLVPAERDAHRCWLAGGREPGPNRPTQPAWNWTLPGASRTVTFAER
jgi:hypothetical protein